MPLLRTETIHGWVCKFYDNGTVMVGTTSDRFAIKVATDEASWFATRLRTELIKRELVAANELPVDESGETMLAAKSAANARAAAQKAAAKKAAASPAKKAAARLEAAQHHERIAGHKRQLAELGVKHAKLMANVAKAVPLAAQLATVAPAAAPIQAKLEAFMRRPVG